MRKLSKEQILLLHTQLIEKFGGSDGALCSWLCGRTGKGCSIEKRKLCILYLRRKCHG